MLSNEVAKWEQEGNSLKYFLSFGSLVRFRQILFETFKLKGTSCIKAKEFHEAIITYSVE